MRFSLYDHAAGVETRAGTNVVYLDPADEHKPKLQRPTILLEQPIAG